MSHSIYKKQVKRDCKFLCKNKGIKILRQQKILQQNIEKFIVPYVR